MFLTRVAAAVLGALVLWFGAADARNTTRSCDGNYLIVATLVDGLPPTRRLEWPMGGFAATASCGRTEPDHCRVIARDRIFRCFREHFADRWSRRRPEICRQVQRYAIDDIKTVMEQKVCCSAEAAQLRNITVSLIGQTRGQGPCSIWPNPHAPFPGPPQPRTAVIAPEYKMNCVDLRAQLCPVPGSGALRIEHRFDRPGSDYRSFEEKNRDACRDACKADARCKAFTWERPSAVNRIARCWLKDAVPPRVPSKCCDSGYK